MGEVGASEGDADGCCGMCGNRMERETNNLQKDSKAYLDSMRGEYT